MPLWARVWRDDDLGPMVDTLRRLMLDGTVRMVPQVMNTLLYGSVFTTRAQWWQERANGNKSRNKVNDRAKTKK